MRFIINEHNVTGVEGPEIVVQAESFIIHQDYNTKNFVYDLCMVRAAIPIDFHTAAIAVPPCLPENQEDIVKAGRECYVAGWGAKGFLQVPFQLYFILLITSGITSGIYSSV